MRTSLLTTLLGLSLVACAGQITGGGGDDDVPENCGNGTVDVGEECDGGDTCSATCTLLPVPRVSATVDKMTVATELMRVETVTLNLTSTNGFSGNATIAASIVDATNAPLTQVTLTGPTSVTLGQGQSMPAAYVVTIPSNATGTDLTGTLKLDVTAAGETQNFTTAFTIAARLIIPYKAGIGDNAGAQHPVKSGDVPAAITVKRGAIIGYKNDDNIQHTTHGSGGVFAHESGATGVNDPNIGLAGNTYSLPTIQAAPGTSGTLGCHSHDNDAGYVNFTIE